MHQLFVVERKVHVRPQITAVGRLGLTWACIRPQSICIRTQITARAGWVLRATVGAFERTKCGRTHFGRIFTLSPRSCPLLAMFVAMTCTTQNTKKLYKILVINAAKSLTNISKGGSNKQYLTPIKYGGTNLCTFERTRF
jgi:hypothetical protein